MDPILLQANELIRQSSIEPKKYIQNQLMLKKNKDKIGNIENSPEPSTNSQKHVELGLDVPELFSTPDIIVDASKTSKTENMVLNPKINIENIVKTTSEKPISDISKVVEQVNVIKEETVRVRKISNKLKENPAEITVTKTVEDILDDISSKVIANQQTAIIDEENLIDELVNLNEDLNSVCKLIQIYKLIQLIKIN